MIFLKKTLRKLLKSQLVAGSAALFAGNIFANFGNYLYHLLMGRMLGPVDYGLLASLISLIYLFNIPMGTLNLVVVKYISALRGKKEFGAITYFYSWLNKKSVIFGLVGFILLTMLSPWFVSFLHIDSSFLVLIIIASSIIGIFLTINNAVLQGFLRFGLMSILGAAQVVLKLGAAILMVFWGLKVLGAVSAILLSIIAGFFLTGFFVARMIQKRKKTEKAIDIREIGRYALPVFFSTLAFVSLYTTDVVLARHFLSAQEAGFYASLATLGKIVFFASNPIIMVMFPMVSERHVNGKKYLDLLQMSFGLVLLACLGISLAYFFFPGLMIGILFGSEYLPAAPYLFLFAIFLSFYSLSYLLTSFYLSIKKTKIVFLPVVAALLQIVLIFLFHRDLQQTVLMSILTTTLLLVGLLFYNSSMARIIQGQRSAAV